MALKPYNGSENPLNRIRSSSCSSPVRNRIVYQEIYSVGSNTLVRSYSCDQVFNKDETGRTFQTTQIQISSFLTPEKKTNGSSRRHKESQTVSPKMALNLPDKSGSKPLMFKGLKTRGRFKKMLIFGVVPILSACILWSYMSYKECSYVWDLEKTKRELMDNVFGQSEAMAKINSVLKQANNSNDFHVVIFTGGVGVGKTFSSLIISRNFPWRSKKLISHSENFTSDAVKLLNSMLSSCGCNLIIIDDLSQKIVLESINLVKLLNNKKKANQKLLLILIFKIQDESERRYVLEQFKNAFVDIYHVPFKPLEKDAVQKCFSVEIQRHGIVIPEDELSRLINEKMKHVDVAKGPVGCKGVTDDVLGYYNKN